LTCGFVSSHAPSSSAAGPATQSFCRVMRISLIGCELPEVEPNASRSLIVAELVVAGDARLAGRGSGFLYAGGILLLGGSGQVEAGGLHVGRPLLPVLDLLLAVVLSRGTVLGDDGDGGCTQTEFLERVSMLLDDRLDVFDLLGGGHVLLPG